MVVGISVGFGFIVFLFVHFLVAPWLKKRIDRDPSLQVNERGNDTQHGDQRHDFTRFENEEEAQMTQTTTFSLPEVSVQQPAGEFSLTNLTC